MIFLLSLSSVMCLLFVANHADSWQKNAAPYCHHMCVTPLRTPHTPELRIPSSEGRSHRSPELHALSLPLGRPYNERYKRKWETEAVDLMFKKEMKKSLIVKYSRASLIRTNWDSVMFGSVNFRINRVLQNTRRGGGGSNEQALDETGDILQMKQLPGREEADDVDIRQWILADDCDVGHQMYTR
jgi:hypothetical protein